MNKKDLVLNDLKWLICHQTKLNTTKSNINRLTIIRKSGLSDKKKWEVFQTVAVSRLLYGFSIWTLTKHSVKKFARLRIRILHTILYKSGNQYPTKRQLTFYLTTHQIKMSACWVLCMHITVMAGQQKLTFISSVRTLDAVKRVL